MTENAVSTTPGSRLSALARKLWFPFFLLLLTILTYGLLTYRQGFYLDDWYIILFKEKLGNQGFMLYFSQDRPFLSYPYVLLMAVFGESAVNWAIFALVMRWVTTCTFWQLLNKLFPDQKKLWIWATVLFAVYPGFRFHWFAIMYAFGYIFLTFYLLSFFAMAKALDHTSKPWLYGFWMLLGLLFLLIGIVPQEYFSGWNFSARFCCISSSGAQPQTGKKQPGAGPFCIGCPTLPCLSASPPTASCAAAPTPIRSEFWISFLLPHCPPCLGWQNKR